MKTDGGPAFPQHGWTSNPDVLARMADQGGMSLRDWLAGQALAGIYAGFGGDRVTNGLPDITWEDVAKEAVGAADALLFEPTEATHDCK